MQYLLVKDTDGNTALVNFGAVKKVIELHGVLTAIFDIRPDNAFVEISFNQYLDESGEWKTINSLEDLYRLLKS